MKSIFASKTFWSNVVMTIASVVSEFNGILPPGVAPIVQGVVNVALRFLSSTPVNLTGK